MISNVFFTDFAYEYKASCLQIDKIDIKRKPCLEFVYDDIDLDNEALSTMLLYVSFLYQMYNAIKHGDDI